MTRAILITSLSLMSLVAGAATGGTPYVLNHSGHLIDSGDAALNSPSLAMSFRIFVAAAAGGPQTSEWEATCTVDVVRGFYTAHLGEAPCDGNGLDTADLPIGAARYLEIAIGSVTLAPRLLVTSVPSAMIAHDAEQLGGVAAGAFALKSDTAPDSAKLGGVEASAYLLKTAVPESAANALQLGGVAASEYLLKSELPATASNALKLGGVDASGYLLAGGTAVNATALGGVAAGQYALKTDTAPDALKLGGVAASSLLGTTGNLLASAAQTGPNGFALLDNLGRIPRALLPAGTATTASGTKTGAANGECLTVNHGFGTFAVGHSALMSLPDGTWIPVPAGYEPGTTNLALNQPATASGVLSSAYAIAQGNDGRNDKGWEPNSATLGWWQVDLGSVRPISTLRVLPSWSTDSWAATSWNIQLSADGNTFASPVATGTCTKPGNCDSYFTHTLPAGTAARFVRYNGLSFVNGITLYELEAYATTYTVSFPTADTARLCNYTGITRDLTLLVWR